MQTNIFTGAVKHFTRPQSSDKKTPNRRTTLGLTRWRSDESTATTNWTMSHDDATRHEFILGDVTADAGVGAQTQKSAQLFVQNYTVVGVGKWSPLVLDVAVARQRQLVQAQRFNQTCAHNKERFSRRCFRGGCENSRGFLELLVTRAHALVQTVTAQHA